MSRWTVVLAGGGTGGHIYPGLAIAERLTELNEPPTIQFICSTRAIDERILGARGIAHEAISARPLIVRPKGLARFVGSWGGAVRSARRILREARGRADHVDLVALGGFVAAPAVQAARAERIGVTLVNLDAVPGKANRWIARHARRVLSACPTGRASWETVGPIVRAAAIGSDPRSAREGLGLEPDAPTLLITGGSQGAASINGAMAILVERHPGLFGGGARRWQVIHQTGGGGVERARSSWESAGITAEVEAFIEEMGRAWCAADAAVSRAGAGSVFEAWANRTPTVFLPFPYHRDQHQRANAEPLVRAGGAVLVEDRIEASATADRLATALEAVLGSERVRAQMREALGRLGPVDGARRVAEVLAGQRPIR